VSETPIIAIHVGDAAKAFEFSRNSSKRASSRQLSLPIVAEGKARLRAIVSAAHKREQLLRAQTLAEVAKPLGSSSLFWAGDWCVYPVNPA